MQRTFIKLILYKIFSKNSVLNYSGCSTTSNGKSKKRKRKRMGCEKHDSCSHYTRLLCLILLIFFVFFIPLPLFRPFMHPWFASRHVLLEVVTKSPMQQQQLGGGGFSVWDDVWMGGRFYDKQGGKCHLRLSEPSWLRLATPKTQLRSFPDTHRLSPSPR